MSDLGAAFQERLRKLQESYRRGLPAKLERVQSLGTELCEEWPTEGFEDLFHLVHKMAGSAATFGYEPLGQAAAKLEDRLRVFRDEDRGPDAAEREQIRALLAEIAAAGQS